MVIRLVISLLAMLIIQFPFQALLRALNNSAIPSDRDIYLKPDGFSWIACTSVLMGRKGRLLVSGNQCYLAGSDSLAPHRWISWVA